MDTLKIIFLANHRNGRKRASYTGKNHRHHSITLASVIEKNWDHSYNSGFSPKHLKHASPWSNRQIAFQRFGICVCLGKPGEAEAGELKQFCAEKRLADITRHTERAELLQR